MQSSAFALSPSIPLLRSRNSNPNPRCRILSTFSAAKPSVAPIRGCGASGGLRTMSPRLGGWEQALFSSPSPRQDLVVRASSVPESAGESPAKASELQQTLLLGSLFGLWYLFNIYFNIYNKQVLKVFPNPLTITTCQFLIGTVFVLFVWTTNLYRRPKITSSQLLAILPLAIVHTLGNLFTNMSLGKVAVSFTHTIKAMEPFFSVLLSALFLGEMELQNTPMTVQLGQGARIQLANAVINAGSSGATIQFGSVDFPAVVARTAATSAYGTDFERPARRPHSVETSARSAHLSAPRVTVTQEPRRRISVFERISQPEAPATKRIVTGGRISVVTANTTTLPTGSPASGNNNVETSSSGGRLTRRQRRKRNAEPRAQQQFSTHPSNMPAQELEATIPTQNGFSNLKWVKRNSSTGELKKSFWEQRREVPTPPKKKEPESLSARIYRVLKTVNERGLTKRKIQRPLRVETRRAPPKERLSVTTRIRERRYTPRGEHRGVTPERRVQGSTAERSRWKGKQIWRPRPHRDEERKEREIDLGVTSGVASRRSAPNSRDRRRWVQKKTHDDACYNCRHLGESSRGSRHSPTPPKEEVNFDRSPRVEEILLPNKEPEIQWRRRSEIRLLGEGENMEENMKEEYLKDEDYMEDEQEEMNDTINMEVVYMVRHVEVEYDDGEDDGDWQPHPQQEYQHQHEAGSIADGGNRSQGEQEADEVEQNHSDDENITLANIRRQMRRQMRAKDREISQLNEKMTEMMAQMTVMMRVMQRTAVAGAIPNPPADPPNLRMPQVSGVRGARRGEADSTFFSRVDKGKQVVYNVDKGKQPMQYEEKPKQVYNPNPQPKLILGGNDKPRNF
ncbi:hypothetical protein M5K25_008481 [Dendrobium thyrsiflorum]|uniref:Sugar phosphate transporter domain-containing protein n=1 Tax=Dendrobium thyrsiflorum TaxID=117978 RepID=A0ABD0V8T3_DENTH